MGFIILLLSALCFSSSTFFGKIITNVTGMSGVINSFSRFFIGFIIMTIYMLVKKKSFKSPDIKPIILRGVFNSITMVLLMTALNYTTVTNANMLNMTYPVFVVLLVPLVSKEEKIKKNTYIYLLLIMLGSYILANPSFGNVNKGDVLGMISSLTGALSIIFLKKSRKNNEGYMILFYVTLIGTIISLPFSINTIANFDMNGLIYVIISGILGFLGQIFITWGFKYVDSATGSLISASRIVISAVLGILFLNEPFNPRVLVSMVLIFGSLVGLSGFFDKDRKLDPREG